MTKVRVDVYRGDTGAKYASVTEDAPILIRVEAVPDEKVEAPSQTA